MKNRIVILAVLLPFLASVPVSGADSLVFTPGKVIPMGQSFLENLQKRDSVLIADQVLYGCELKDVEEGTLLGFPEVKQEENASLLVLGEWQIDTLKVRKQKKGAPSLLDIRAALKMTAFDEGEYSLPAIAVARLDREGVVDTLVFDPSVLSVKTMPVDTATFQLHDIKGQIKYPVTFREILPYLCLGLLLAGLVALIVFLVRKYRRKKVEAELQDPAHIVALRKLENYRGDRLWAPEKQKQFYSGVTDTLREYVVRRYGISAMEMTTKEIFDDLKGTDVPGDLYAELKELFERADFVKFAKYVADNTENASAVPLAVRFVTTTYQSEIEGPSDAEKTASVEEKAPEKK
ncbi:MAG: hypothetical protein ACI4QG_04850 [Candidatus Cryptobacteroides sp.]